MDEERRYPNPLRERDFHPVLQQVRDGAIKIQDELRTKLAAMTAERDALRGSDELGSGCYHDSPDSCPTYYDGCNCSVYNLLGVREQLIVEVERLRGLLGEAVAYVGDEVLEAEIRAAIGRT